MGRGEGPGPGRAQVSAVTRLRSLSDKPETVGAARGAQAAVSDSDSAKEAWPAGGNTERSRLTTKARRARFHI